MWRLTPEQIQQATDTLKAKRKGAYRCLWCDSDRLAVNATVYEWPDCPHDHDPNSAGTYGYLPAVVLACTDCGFLLPFDAFVLGFGQPAILGPPDAGTSTTR